MDTPLSLKVTKRTVTSIECEWLINSNCSCPKQDGIKSPIFPLDPTQAATVQWQIKMLKTKKIVNNQEVVHTGLWLYASSETISSGSVSFAFEIDWGTNAIECRETSRIKTYEFDPATGGAVWKEIGGWPEMYSDKFYKDKYLSRYTLKQILCTIDIVNEQKEAPAASLFFTIPSSCLWESFETLLTTGKNADTTLVANDNDQKINAHKAILMARSPVFDAMFRNQMSESLDKLVVLEDLDFEVLDEMVRFIYTGKVSNLSTTADRLLMAADKYDLPTLRAMCEQEIGINLSVEHAAQTLVLADLHHASQLKKYTLRFIKHHAQQVLATDGWQEIAATYPHLLNEVCKSLATYAVA